MKARYFLYIFNLILFSFAPIASYSYDQKAPQKQCTIHCGSSEQSSPSKPTYTLNAIYKAPGVFEKWVRIRGGRGDGGHKGHRGQRGHRAHRGHHGRRGCQGRRGKTGKDEPCIIGQLELPYPNTREGQVVTSTGSGEGFTYEARTLTVKDGAISIEVDITITDPNIDIEKPVCVQASVEIADLRSTTNGPALDRIHGPIIDNDRIAPGFIPITIFRKPINPTISVCEATTVFYLHFKICNCD